MSSVNLVVLVGRVGQDPKFSATSGGQENAKFSIATSRKWRDKSGDRKEKTTWHQIVVWNERLIPYVRDYVKKGSLVYVKGEIWTRSWDKDNGEKQYVTEIVLDTFGSEIKGMESAGARDRRDGGGDGNDRDAGRVHDFEREQRGNGKPASGKKQPGEFELDDEIPF